MDRERLKEVHKSDLTEGRINEDFVDWLKTKGTTWLLVIVVALLAYAGMVRWSHHRTSYQAKAWTELSTAVLPSNLEDVAEKYTDVGAVSHLARLGAASKLLNAVQSGQTLGADDQTRTPLDEATRTDYLNRADGFYAKVLEADDGTRKMALLAGSALSGRAAVAESKGELELAKQYYSQAAERAGGHYPMLAEQSRDRAAKVEKHVQTVTLPTRDQLMAVQQRHPLVATQEPVWTAPWVNDLLIPKQ